MKTTKEIIEESNFNYLQPQASLNRIEKTDNQKWFSVSDVEQLQKEIKEIIIVYDILGYQFVEDRLQSNESLLLKNIDEVFNNFKGK